MSIDFQWEPDGVAVRHHGTFTPEVALRCAEQISSDERMDALRHVLVDLRAVDRFEFGSGHASTLDSAVAIWIGVAYTNPRIAIGLILPDGAARAPFREAFEDLPFRYEFFDSEDAARHWIRQIRLDALLGLPARRT